LDVLDNRACLVHSSAAMKAARENATIATTLQPVLTASWVLRGRLSEALHAAYQSMDIEKGVKRKLCTVCF
jgi:hypothetical protein